MQPSVVPLAKPTLHQWNIARNRPTGSAARRDAAECSACWRRRAGAGRVELKPSTRSCVTRRRSAPTVPWWSEVPAAGPLLPAEARDEDAGVVRAEEARRSSASVHGEPPPEIEKFMTSTMPSATAWLAACVIAELGAGADADLVRDDVGVAARRWRCGGAAAERGVQALPPTVLAGASRGHRRRWPSAWPRSR